MKSLSNTKTSTIIRDLTEDERRRFRTRGQRRKKRYPLSPLWPPAFKLNAQQLHINYTVENETTEPKIQSSTLGVDDQQYIISWHEKSLSICDSTSKRTLIELPQEHPWFTAQERHEVLHEESGFFHIKSRRSKTKK